MKKPQFVFTFATVFMVLLLGVSFVTFNGSLNSHVRTDIEKRLQEGLEPNLMSFNLQMSEQVKKVNTLAGFLGENWDIGADAHQSLLQSAAKNNGLLRCALAYPDGSFITHDNKNDGSVSKDAFFLANMAGEFFITDPRPAVVDTSKRVILIAAPVFDQNRQVIASIIYSYLCDDMDRIFNLKSMGGKMNMVVTKADGTLLIGNSEFADAQESVLGNLRELCTHKSHHKSQCLTLGQSSGMYVITPEKGEALYVRYDKVEFKDWYMVAIVPEDAAVASISFAARNQRVLSVTVAVIILAYLGIILFMWLTQRRMIDPDTGALTIYAFKRKAKKIFKHRTHENFVLVKLDVKDFKLINRIYSFEIGDKVIRNIADSLRYVLYDDESIFARIGVDVFVLLIPYHGSEALTAKRHDFINHFRMLMDVTFSTKVSFPTGQYILKSDDFPKPDIDELLEKANFAHRAAKQKTDVIIDYEDDIERAALFEKKIEDRMEEAIREEEFTLYLQPKVRLSDEKICGAEALVRWKVGDTYYMYPTDFVPVLEKNGFIVQLDKYMFSCAARDIRARLDEGIQPVPISVNFSRHHLNNEKLVSELCSIADKYQVPRKYLEVEITESAFLGDVQTMVTLIQNLHQEGFLISMDDFGTGYSCFSQLKDLKIDVLKIDRGFFEHSEDGDRAEVVIAGIIKIAQDLHIVTVAEGIEDKEQVEMLRTLGCDIIQGYYFGKPRSANEFWNGMKE